MPSRKLEPASLFPKPSETEDRIHPAPCTDLLKAGDGGWISITFFSPLLQLLLVETMAGQGHAVVGHGQKLILTERSKVRRFKTYMLSAFDAVARKTDCIYSQRNMMFINEMLICIKIRGIY